MLYANDFVQIEVNGRLVFGLVQPVALDNDKYTIQTILDKTNTFKRKEFQILRICSANDLWNVFVGLRNAVAERR